MDFINQTIQNLSTAGVIPTILYLSGVFYIVVLVFYCIYLLFRRLFKKGHAKR